MPSMLCDSSINDSDTGCMREELKAVDVYSCDLHKGLLLSTASLAFGTSHQYTSICVPILLEYVSQIAIQVQQEGKWRADDLVRRAHNVENCVATAVVKGLVSDDIHNTLG